MPDGWLINGSAAINSRRKPGGNFIRLALSAGESGLGASLGLGICP
ncbi:uncharacterized protein METZ01_LOCUS445513 [marine metagenome]|uniref:Uncharacterized protein n=1 Tax=marine metagenome TaxID=408172 RepID=A0A382ZBS8_9ZZZZ